MICSLLSMLLLMLAGLALVTAGLLLLNWAVTYTFPEEKDGQS